MCKLQKREAKAEQNEESQRMKANNHNKAMPRSKPSMESRSPMNAKIVVSFHVGECLL